MTIAKFDRTHLFVFKAILMLEAQYVPTCCRFTLSAVVYLSNITENAVNADKSNIYYSQGFSWDRNNYNTLCSNNIYCTFFS